MKKKIFILQVILITTMLSASDWQLKRDRDNIIVYTRDIPNEHRMFKNINKSTYTIDMGNSYVWRRHFIKSTGGLTDKFSEAMTDEPAFKDIRYRGGVKNMKTGGNADFHSVNYVYARLGGYRFYPQNERHRFLMHGRDVLIVAFLTTIDKIYTAFHQIMEKALK